MHFESILFLCVVEKVDTVKPLYNVPPPSLPPPPSLLPRTSLSADRLYCLVTASAASQHLGRQTVTQPRGKTTR